VEDQIRKGSADADLTLTCESSRTRTSGTAWTLDEARAAANFLRPHIGMSVRPDSGMRVRSQSSGGNADAS